MPFVAIVTIPAMMMTYDRIIACQRQRRKSKFG
jgi:hypothetical protein